jgi:glycosyltransferase involved in cell wall biosynthesis
LAKFAVTIPNLNQSRFLPTVLNSLRQQKRPFELSVMDGDSKDNFKDVVREYHDIINYSRTRPDGGQSHAIAEGWSYVEGDILTWINADDYYFPNCFQIVGEIFEKERSIDIVYGDAIHVDAEGQFIAYFPAIKEFDRTVIGYDCFICQPACFMRRSTYENISGICKELKYTMDWDLWCQFANANAKFKYVKLPLAAVRYYPGTKTLSRNITRYKEIFRMERKYANRFLPCSVFGADYYGIGLKKEKRLIERIYFILYKSLKRIKVKFSLFKNRLETEKNSLLYGFERWENKVHRECTVHLPWYPNHKWRELIIQTDVGFKQLEVKINSTCTEGYENAKGEICIALNELWRPMLCIEIKSRLDLFWHLKKIKCI